MGDEQQILGGGDVHQGADLGDHAATVRRHTLGTKRKEPDLALHVGGQGQRTSRRLGVRERGEILDVPIQRAGRQLGDCLLRHVFYDKLLLLLVRRCRRRLSRGFARIHVARAPRQRQSARRSEHRCDAPDFPPTVLTSA